ncbi:BrnA antitoxin family protein [Pararhodospirillum oryzae]|uniref:Antitoxin n=1 Tax=Pararhodospirillum oryzae TaxID=478448 RepID=A0A512HBR6_9PROT|nr:BrnA antitoxin family protein [Pararhodospirillum oryzae]GEO82885.1 hypothetical protein ROR02_30160 [Pararhodospirillum oryzae]
MKKSANDSKPEWIDPDDAPELTEAWFADAVRFNGGESMEEIVAQVRTSAHKGGRPRSTAPKKIVSLRLDPDVVAHFRAQGPGWQTRINTILRDAAGLGPR